MNTGALRRLVLIAASAATVAAVVWVSGEEENIEEVAEPARRTPAKPAERKPEAAAPADLPAWQRPTAAAPGANDPFRPTSWYVPPPPPPPVPARPAEPPPPPPVPQAPALPFAFVGRMLEEGRTVVYLAAGDRAITAEVGEVIDTNYRVESIEDRQITFQYLPLGTRQTLPIGDRDSHARSSDIRP